MKKHKAYLIVDVISLSLPLIVIAMLILKLWGKIIQETSVIFAVSYIAVPALFYLTFYTSLIRGDRKIAIAMYAFLSIVRIIFLVILLSAIFEIVLHIPIFPFVLFGSFYWGVISGKKYYKKAETWYAEYYDEEEEGVCTHYCCPSVYH